ncbi:hypothetical protein OG883_37390 [Streptomyces sp. NBC_01142]|uniref:hypothetical protein n=1 Tax=Streptomyces sp. NBC_01142 TaxID=2975865 RepID=UPI00225AF902|nr:hypothetical protein [Streptomyces sp. NBC_01142]MCX4825432.1 hypothetical protein [Streptomyces sp. NBC_01142]
MTRRAGRTRRRLFEHEIELAAAGKALGEPAGLRPEDADPPEHPRGALLAFAGHAGLGRATLLTVQGRDTAAVPAALHLDEQTVTRLLGPAHGRAGTGRAGLAGALRVSLAEAPGGGHGR